MRYEGAGIGDNLRRIAREEKCVLSRPSRRVWVARRGLDLGRGGWMVSEGSRPPPMTGAASTRNGPAAGAYTKNLATLPLESGIVAAFRGGAVFNPHQVRWSKSTSVVRLSVGRQKRS